jgi:serine/threonine-protein kinase
MATTSDELTRAGISTVGVTADSNSGSTVTPATGGTHLAPGAIVAGRYRVVALLGRGGMGEVYRAEDLTLEQPVALKFLPGTVGEGDVRLAQFHNELKTARQVSHKNVCRLYDLGEANGRRFLTMEYVDGEDLSSLLRRIGRLPHDKAVDIARQLCAGVAAAHDRGVVHRDLKPSNVMIDADGNVRITDFGIATGAANVAAEFTGTPQYMAPEQFAGQPASFKSDIFALGLILFEVFTGRRAVDAQTLPDLREFHHRGAITTPSSVVRDMDPAVERLILRCLEREPAQRPLSALLVAAALPGADPLAAALAAGETPSPDLLAAAGETEAVSARTAIALTTVALIGMIVFSIVSARTSLIGMVPLDLPPAVLVDRAEAIIAAFGYTREPGDTMYGFDANRDYTRWLLATRETPDRYEPVRVGRPPAIVFWYRTALGPLVAQTDPFVSPTDPPPLFPAMRTVVLDGHGRLQEFRTVPPQRDDDVEPAAAPHWEGAFTAAGLDMAAFTAVTPIWVPRDFAYTRIAW